MKLGIGIITYKRRGELLRTITAVRKHTKTPFQLVIAEDGANDGMVEWLRKERIPTVTGENMGVAWNKNRALFLLVELGRCDVVILLEDDAFPTQDGWEANWIRAADQHGHINLAGEWFAKSFVSGMGTPDDPVLSRDVSGQVAGFSRFALLYGGYLDPRFRGYGYGHVEHSRRLVDCGYGGRYETIDGKQVPLYALLRAPGITVTTPPTFAQAADRERNERLAQQLVEDTSHRMPWSNRAELARFAGEMAAYSVAEALATSAKRS